MALIDTLSIPEATAALDLGDSIVADLEVTESFSALSGALTIDVSDGPIDGSVSFNYNAVYNGLPEVLSGTETLALDGSGAVSFPLSFLETATPGAAVPDSFYFEVVAQEYLDGIGDPWVGTPTWTLGGTLSLYGATPVVVPAIPESLMADLRALYSELVTDTSVANDRAILISSRQEVIGTNGERTYTTTEVDTVYGQASYTTQSAATRALGRPTGERVVQITLPYDAPFSTDYIYTVDGAAYSPIPGEDNLGTAYRAYTQFLAKRRS